MALASKRKSFDMSNKPDHGMERKRQVMDKLFTYKSVVAILAIGSAGFYQEAAGLNHIESSLDSEFRGVESNVPHTKWQRLRMKGQQILLGKYVLMVVVALCILDCCLVITELILDIHAIKDALKDSKYGPSDYYDSQGTSHSSAVPTSTDIYGNPHVTPRPKDATHIVHKRAAGHDVPLSLKIAHGCHYASVAILGVLLVYVLFKVVFFGKEMFKKKIEMFDAFVVLASFALDLAFLDGLTNGPIEETAFILSFFVPWRVLRVVNSLVVAILEHEHYKLVLVYKSKKRVEQTLDEVREELHEATNCAQKIKDLALQSGVDEWKVNFCLADARHHDGKKNALSSFAALSFGAMGGGKKSPHAATQKNSVKMPQLERNIYLPKPEQNKTTPNGYKPTSIANELKPTGIPNGHKPLAIQQDVLDNMEKRAENNSNAETTESVKSVRNRKDSRISVSTIATSDALGTISEYGHLGKHVTVLNIDGDDREDLDGKTDHIAIHIAISTQDSSKCLITNDDSDETSQTGLDNPAFAEDNDITHL